MKVVTEPVLQIFFPILCLLQKLLQLETNYVCQKLIFSGTFNLVPPDHFPGFVKMKDPMSVVYLRLVLHNVFMDTKVLINETSVNY